jgi:hypothetical protein
MYTRFTAACNNRSVWNSTADFAIFALWYCPGGFMPRTEAAPRVETRLHPEDFKDLKRFCYDQSQTKGQVVRDAIVRYLRHHKNLEAQETEAHSSSQLKKIADRIWGLLYKLGVDCNATARCIWETSDDTERDIYEQCHSKAVIYM